MKTLEDLTKSGSRVGLIRDDRNGMARERTIDVPKIVDQTIQRAQKTRRAIIHMVNGRTVANCHGDTDYCLVVAWPRGTAIAVATRAGTGHNYTRILGRALFGVYSTPNIDALASLWRRDRPEVIQKRKSFVIAAAAAQLPEFIKNHDYVVTNGTT